MKQLKQVTRYVAAFLVALLSGLLSLVARAGGGDVFEPLRSVTLFGSSCASQNGSVGGETVVFVCNFDPLIPAGLAGMPRFEGDVTASLSVVQQDREAGTPLERRAVKGIVSRIRLYDGTECLSSSGGATLAFDGKRLNFTCSPGRFVLLGPLQSLGNTLLAERVVIEQTEAGFVKTRGDIVPVEAITVDAESTPQ